MSVKRAMDLAAGGLLLLVALPIFLPVMAVLAVTGEREIFFAQERVGRGGRRFRLLKFVTMRKNSENVGTGTLTVTGDARVLPVGRFLRKAKINELPQLWNVLAGDMGLVGPRPLAEQEFLCYAPEVQAKITRVRPGLTGLGSVVFRDEETILARSVLPPLEAYRSEISPLKGRLESWYVDHRSIWLDLKLLIATGVVVLLPDSRVLERWLPDLPRDPIVGA
jgi:lipopolysaccharide/colanic/teichoic acid biosynthesis glycosyltransferase